MTNRDHDRACLARDIIDADGRVLLTFTVEQV